MISSLSNLSILALDIQTTGATPANGRILEIGWKIGLNVAPTPSNLINTGAYLLKPSHKTILPKSIRNITGISEKDLMTGQSEATIRQKLHQAVTRVANANQSARCVTVIHFARFETPFLRALTDDSPLFKKDVFEIICTHEIVRRLIPDLPRKGLRAVAGYFDHPLPELKRTTDHVRATAAIWHRLVGILTRTQNIETLPQLLEWLRQPPPAKTRRVYPMQTAQRQKIPDQPGVYHMLRKNKEVLYVGKAASLKNRVNSYFRPKSVLSEHILEMLTQAYRLDIKTTPSALEAALLENDNIKKKSPPYNVALRRRHRRLVFVSRDLTQSSDSAGITVPIGPLPQDRTIAAMNAFAALTIQGIKPDCPEEIGKALLALPNQTVPDTILLKEGVDLFIKRHQKVLTQGDNGHALKILMRLGRQFWQAAVEKSALDKNQKRDGPDGHPPTEKPFEWTPDRVANGIEHVVKRSAHMIRRARWFCLLSESTLSWTSPRVDTSSKFLLKLEKGRVSKRQTVPLTVRFPDPTRSNKSWLQRKQAFDLVTYDRLRILTTELRRLVADKREINLRLGPGIALNRNRLAQLLLWV